MEFIDHTVAWSKGEDLETILMTVAGVMTLGLAGAFWFFGTTPGAKAIVLPLAAIAAILIAFGIGTLIGSPARLDALIQAWQADPQAFVTAEKARVEGFVSLYRGTIIGAAIACAIAVLIFTLSLNLHLRSIAIALVLLSALGLIVDYFSKERADTYYRAILDESKTVE